MKITTKEFGITKTGEAVTRFSLSNKNNMQVDICNIGCSIISVLVPDKNGELRDVALGFDTSEEYEENPTCFGCVVGRVGNRIKDGAFTLNGITYQLEKNDGNNHLHGGSHNFAKKYWTCTHAGEDSLDFRLESPDGEGGYPGNIVATISYTLSDDNALTASYHVTSPDMSICNLTNHSYFNLSGTGNPSIRDHMAMIRSDYITESDSELIPTGKLLPVENTPFDFRQEKAIGQDIDDSHPQIVNGWGYDHNYVLSEGEGPDVSVRSPLTGICMQVYTNSPGMQFYTANHMDGSVRGKNGVYHPQRSGFCVETQLFPDGINHPEFPSCVVTPAQPQDFYTTYQFSIQE